MNRLLVVVDMQNDFINGALGTKEAELIVGNVVNKIKEYQRNGDSIIFTQDTHFDNYLETNEGKKLPVKHCIKNTDGWEISKEIQKICNLKDHKVYEKVTFGSSELAKDLADGVYNEYSEIELIGICTDICVISNTLLMKTFLPEKLITVDAACCAGITPQSHKQALEVMKMCHIDVME
ncbi:nicotinamidase-related amidase [Mobilisporobacter senegalensis]|uniref:nicotinamidase n=1 Tax=Mobilisporobacter senegalensis TaxID=1329262 RepID=A0A3N1XZ12_9FIRM|nr:isochorismatase family cysteine hydrolase [Mobilisporobacter senegalensis]ROR31845.1 nicotinamidase-related amidase [Mobilisporobacter senegalensis]